MLVRHINYAIECIGYFLLETRSETYLWYVERVLQRKNKLGVNNLAEFRALLGSRPGGA